LLLVIMSPLNSVAGGFDFTFNPGSVNLAAVTGETATQAVQATNVSGKAIQVSSITIELDSNACSESDIYIQRCRGTEVAYLDAQRQAI
jgi:hypothetical protein